MKLPFFGLELRRAPVQKYMQPPNSGRWARIFDTFAGQWQQDVSIDADEVLTNSAVFACIRLISADIGKLRICLVQWDATAKIWEELESAAFSPVLRKPNSTQTRIKFYEQWMVSKLIYGNTYVLKSRDARGVVNALRVLDPNRVMPLVSDAGEVFYRLSIDQLAQIDVEVVVPAREIIHDIHISLDHPLVGVSPITACALAATQGVKIQNNSTRLFANMSRPSFVLSAPGNISDDTAARLKAQWEANFGGDNYGRTAVLGDGLKPEAFTITAADSQLIEQLGWTAEDICRAFGVPAYKIGVGPMPAFNNIETLDQAYYSQTLQEPIECIELLLDEGLELPTGYGTEFDLDGLLRMDTLTQVTVLSAEIKAGYLSANEARQRRGLPPVVGGESPLSQQQNYSLAALAKRDASADPFGTAKAAAPPQPDSAPAADEVTPATKDVAILEQTFLALGNRLIEQQVSA